MKALLLSLALASATPVAQAQGTIAFGNSALTPIRARLLDGRQRPANARGDVRNGAFDGAEGTVDRPVVLARGRAGIGPVDGVMINAASVFPRPGTERGKVISLQTRVWDAAHGPDGWSDARL